ncbi:hypothetical protein DDZ18_06975 [Marinicauda salina]|uniref:TonB-dependent receptor n=1 Tax=Marinicauda salina TaxID=2135793 RepID=A0A2U2BTV1_9PROT|nr:TonB-dependent receptor [Marinicauda salina]PWE17417.1 hypothetical protein DDZ18_06975 [Marinicauda salina]
MRLLRTSAASLLALSTAAPALAQPADDGEVITVIGGRAPGADIADRPVTTISREDLAARGFDDPGDALAFLPSVVGSEFNDDPGTQNDTSGTSSVNLRGLGLGATLVLMNGQRQTPASVASDDGASIVDMNALVPAIAIERVSVLKDGASPVYGSDAVAGVVDVTTRDRFEGVEASAELRGPTEYDGAGGGYELAAIAGRDFGGAHLTAAVEWLDRRGLEGFQTDFVPGTGLSALGQPGAYFVTDPGGGFAVANPDGSPIPVIDRDCEAGGGNPLVLGADTAFGTPGYCRLDYGQFFSVVTDEERLSGFAALSTRIGETEITLRGSGADQLVERGNSPSLPNLNFPLIPASHPGNYFGRDVVWLGRPQGVEAGAARRQFDHDTWRIAAEAERGFTLGGIAWTGTARATYSRNDLTATITDTLAPNFDAALAGFGGADCPVREAGQGVAAGDQSAGCFYFNPFGSGGLVEDPSDPRFNDPAVLDYIIGEDVRTSRADLAVFEAVAATDALFALPAGDVSAAFGVQLRRETLRVDHGADFNADDFLFIIGGPDFSGARDARAVFADAIVPVTDRLELQLAARHEDLDGFSSTDPKIAAVFDASDQLTLRGSWSRSFRAPSLHQQVSATTTLQSLDINAQSLFRPVRTIGDPDLDPETADTFTLGAVFERAGFTASLDLWRVEYKDLIVEESANAILAADLEDDGVFNDPRVELSGTGDVVLVRAAFTNAPEVEAQGIDAAFETAPVGFAGGDLTVSARGSYIDEFTLIDPVLNREIDAAGNRNFTNFARSVPEFRGDVNAAWTRGPWRAVAGVRHISSYDDDENAGAEIDAWTVLDAQIGYSAQVAGKTVDLTFGALNLTDEAAPAVATPLGYDTKIHDPRGRVAYVRVSVRR